MNIHEFRKMIDDIDDALPYYSNKEVTVVYKTMNNRVLGGTPSTKVTGIVRGFDWNDWQIMLQTEDCLIKLT